MDFVTSDLLTDLTRFAPVDELIRAANAVGGGPRVEARARALERIRRTLAGSVDGESWAVAVRDLVEAFTLRHVLRPWLKSIRNSPQSRTEAVEGLVGWYTTIAKRVAEGQGLAHLWN
ncbi:MAG: hypothetical protein JKY65_02900 [Planctomycetes bacterium]|nr:hypothetical protein [Planctomycetota bacterium]